mmetsp:Transcript_3973/g.6085  ORF Transcript_3973/g.6085 Transcript_3973/m.6085 type:complete len:80 (+) Transcript_3973:512-751(+)
MTMPKTRAKTKTKANIKVSVIERNVAHNDEPLPIRRSKKFRHPNSIKSSLEQKIGRSNSNIKFPNRAMENKQPDILDMD